MKRFRSARLAPSAEWKSPWPSMLEGHGFGEWASRGRHVQDLQFREVWSQHRPLSGQVASRALIRLWERRWRGQELRRKYKD